MNHNDNFDENKNTVSSDPAEIHRDAVKSNVDMKEYLKHQVSLLLLAFFGFGYISPLSYVFGIWSSASIVSRLIRKPSPFVFAGTLIGFVLSLFKSVSTESIFMLLFYLLPVIPLYLCTLRCTGVKISGYKGFCGENGVLTEYKPNDYSKTLTAGVMSAVYFALFAFAFALSVISFKGTFGIEAVKDYVNSFMDLLYSASEEIIASMNTGVEEAVSTETIKQAIQTMYLLSVSFIAVLCFSCGYFSTVFFKMSLRSAGVLEKVFPCGYKLKISFVSAVVYILICTFHLFLTFGNDAEMYFVFYNLKIIITHIFLAYGFERAMEFLEERSEVYGGYFKVTAIIAALMLSMLLYSILPPLGVLYIIRNTMNSLKKKFEDGADDDDE
ncbi:MAG: hypothetical protein E7665_03055 [Ruminococcaceae bacterium]|nr:hypothetical protein [Oscillospiraceae bacterium]